MVTTARERFTLIATDGEVERASFAREVEAGLGTYPKRLPCRYFYDDEGSRLFEAICELPEYYLTRAERAILVEHAAAIAGLAPDAAVLVELGSGSAVKTRLLLEAFLRRHGEVRYVPVDISRTVLEESSRTLLEEYEALEILAVAGEYHEGLRQIGAEENRPKLILWLGSNVGNFERPDAAAFLNRLRAASSPRDRLLVGIDLRKDRAILERAYDDSRGVTARFNRNILARVNRELGGHFDPETFRHRAIYEADAGRVEMHLVSTRDQAVRVDLLGHSFRFASGEAIHTENSYKYSRAEIDALAVAAGLRLEHQWLDPDCRFSLNLLAPQR